MGFLTDNTTGVTFRKGFYLRKKHKATTIPHELVHVSQYEKYGIEGFLEKYKEQYFETVFEKGLGKREIPLEREAYNRSQETEVRRQEEIANSIEERTKRKRRRQETGGRRQEEKSRS